MKDLFKNYHKHKVLSNVGILSISALLALSVNMFILSGATGETLKANVLEATIQSEQVNFIASNNTETINFTNSQEMQNVKELSFSLAYNYDILTLGDSSTDLSGAEVSVIENNDGFSSYIMTFSNPININPQTNIINLDYVKTGEDTVHLNVVNVNFKDIQDASYLLSTQGIIF